MNSPHPSPPSPLGLVVLGLLSEEPMHVYRMQKRIRERGKDRVVNVRNRASLYQTIERLVRLGLVEVQATIPGRGYPDRVVYAITDVGRTTARDWLRTVLRMTGGEFPPFVAALAELAVLSPEDARQQLALRAEAKAAELAATDAILRQAGDLPRLFLLEEEYRRVVLTAELGWLRELVAELDDGRLTWDAAWQQAMAAVFNPPDEPENAR